MNLLENQTYKIKNCFKTNTNNKKNKINPN